RTNGFFVAMHDQLRVDLLGVGVAECDHLAKFIAGVHVQQWERNSARIERLLRETKHDAGVLADGVEHHRPRKLRDSFAQDVETLCFESLKVVQPLRWSWSTLDMVSLAVAGNGGLRKSNGWANT